jgi:leucyl aminopeptidase
MTVSEVEKLVQECGKGDKAMKHGGFIDVTDHPDLSPFGLSASVTLPGYPVQPTHQKEVEPLFSSINKVKMTEYNDALSNHFTRYYTTETGKQAAEWIKGTFEKGKAINPSIQVELFAHSWKQPSVIARIPGTGPNKAEVVVIGAHEDSTNGGGNNRSPGADDDASGVTVLLEVYRILVDSKFQPDRTIEFQTYSAEEVGLRGSQDIAAKYQKDNVPVYSMLQMDMTMYSKGSPVQEIGIITDFVDSSLTTFLRKLVDTYANVQRRDSKCGYGCSDHASWTKAGYKSCFPFESDFTNSNKNIHTSQDTIAQLNLDHGVQFVRVGLGYVVELSAFSN